MAEPLMIFFSSSTSGIGSAARPLLSSSCAARVQGSQRLVEQHFEQPT